MGSANTGLCKKRICIYYFTSTYLPQPPPKNTSKTWLQYPPTIKHGWKKEPAIVWWCLMIFINWCSPCFYHYKPPFPWRSTAACHQCHARHLSKIVFELGGQFLLRFLERLHSNPAQVHKPIAPHSLHRSELFGAVICYIAMGVTILSFGPSPHG